MNMREDLEIILITYNRKKHLQNTLNQIFAENSPIKDFDIKILNNKSTDGTTELIEEYRKKCSNITHIIHNRNIGGNGNIARAFEIASKKYVWVLCDDDYFDWGNWEEIEQAINSDYDLIYTCTHVLRDKQDVGQLLHEATLVPACIYKTARINDTIMQNILNTVFTMFSQVALSADIIINNPGKIYILSKDIIKRGVHGEESAETVIRGAQKNLVHPYSKLIFWHIGFMKAAQIIKDKKIRDYVIGHVNFNECWTERFSGYLISMLDFNAKYKNHSIKNLADIFFCLGNRQKLNFIFCLFYYYTLANLIRFDKTNKGIRVILFKKLKTMIWNYNWFRANSFKEMN